MDSRITCLLFCLLKLHCIALKMFIIYLMGLKKKKKHHCVGTVGVAPMQAQASVSLLNKAASVSSASW